MTKKMIVFFVQILFEAIVGFKKRLKFKRKKAINQAPGETLLAIRFELTQF